MGFSSRLVVGGTGIVVWVLYEIRVPREPTVPVPLFNNRTIFSGYLGTALLLSMALVKLLGVRLCQRQGKVVVDGQER